MGDKAYISKLQQQRYITGVEKKKVFPVTVDEAVKVKKEDNTYTTLKLALDSKFGDAMTIKATVQNDEQEEYVYYLFTFKQGIHTEAINSDHQAKLRYALSCSNADFKKLCLEEAGEEIRLAANTPLSVASIEDRINKSNYLRSLYLRIIKLHGNVDSSFVLIDEDGITYTSGDTIYAAKYPKRLTILAENLGFEYINGLIDVIDSHIPCEHYLALNTNARDEEDNNSVNLAFSSVDAGSSSPADFVSPRGLPDSYDTEPLNIANLNAFTNFILGNGISFYVMPSNYPYGGTEAEVINYKSYPKTGSFTIKDVLKLHFNADTAEESPYQYGFPLSTFRVVFEAQDPEAPETPDTPDTPKPFYLDTLNDVAISYDSNWAGVAEVKGRNTTVESHLLLSPSNNRFKAKRYNSADEYVALENLNLTNEEIEAGISLRIVPNDFRDEEHYIPFSVTEAAIFHCVVNVLYGEPGSEVAYGSFNINCAIEDEDFPSSEATINPALTEQVTEQNNYIFYCLLKVSDACNSIQFIGKEITYVLKPDSSLSPAINTVYTFASDWGDEYTSIGDYLNAHNKVNFNDLNIGQTIGVRNDKYIICRVHVDARALVDSALTNVKGHLKFRDLDNNQDSIVHFEYIAGTTPEYIVPNSFEAFATNPPVLTTNQDPERVLFELGKTIMNAMTNVIYEKQLENIRVLSNGYFSGFTELEDASFMQYMLNLKTIPKYAFYNCTNMHTVVLPEGITKIDDYAFAGCENLTEIIIPQSVTYIGDYAFAGCSSLTSIAIPDAVTHLGNEVCIGCTVLTTIDLGAGIERLNGGFRNSALLQDIYLRRCVYNEEREAYEGTFLAHRMGLNLSFSSKWGFADELGEDASNLTIHVPSELLTTYEDEESPWVAAFQTVQGYSTENPEVQLIATFTTITVS